MSHFTHEVTNESLKQVAVTRIAQTISEVYGPLGKLSLPEKELMLPAMFNGKFKYTLLEIGLSPVKKHSLYAKILMLSGGARVNRSIYNVGVIELPAEYIQLIYDHVVMPYVQKARECSYGNFISKEWYTVGFLRELEEQGLTCYPVSYKEYKVVSANSDDVGFLMYRLNMKTLANLSQAPKTQEVIFHAEQLKKLLFLDKEPSF